MKKVTAFCLAFFLVIFGSFLRSFASFPVNEVVRLDLMENKVVGEKVNYTFQVPSDWKQFVIADRQISGNETFVVEKVHFYCSAISGLYKPQLIMTLAVINKAQWSEKLLYQPVLKSKEHVFAVQLGYNGFTNQSDKKLFDTRYQAVASLSQIKKLISIPKGQEETYQNTVFADDMPVDKKVQLVDSVYYVPLRGVCETLGYQVVWLPKTNTIEIKNDHFTDSFQIDKDIVQDYRNIKMRVINGNTYVSTAYFLRILNKNIEIDAQKNIYIFSK